jgi:hypothetical protein
MSDAIAATLPAQCLLRKMTKEQNGQRRQAMRLQLGVVAAWVLFATSGLAPAQVVPPPRDYNYDRPPSYNYKRDRPRSYSYNRPPSNYLPDRPPPYEYNDERPPSDNYVPDRPPAPGYAYGWPPSYNYGQPPFYNYNYDRAYSHFLSSPYSFRTFSSLGQGYRVDTFTPFSSQSFYREPGYEHQRISPRGLERYYIVPGYGEDAATPFWGYGYRVPGYSRHEFIPSTPPLPYQVPSTPDRR